METNNDELAAKDFSMMFKLYLSILLVLLLTFFSFNYAQATPLRVDFSVTDIGSGYYQYDFTFILDNNDSSWISGNSWDWLIFGDRSSGNTGPSPFRPSGSFDWIWLSGDADILGFSSGGREGPLSCFVSNCGVSDGGWTPTAVGDSFSGSGKSTIFIQGDVYWTALQASNGATTAHQQEANRVPLPSTLAIFALALMVLAARKLKPS